MMLTDENQKAREASDQIENVATDAATEEKDQSLMILDEEQEAKQRATDDDKERMTLKVTTNGSQSTDPTCRIGFLIGCR